MTETKYFNNERATIYHYSADYIDILPYEYFSSEKTLSEAINFGIKECSPRYFKIMVTLFDEKYEICKGKIEELDNKTINYFCLYEKHLKVEYITIFENTMYLDLTLC